MLKKTTPLPIERSVSIMSDKSKKPLCTVTELGDGRIKLQVFYNDTGGEAGWMSTKKETLLDMFVSLWPEDVAYQFDTETNDG